MIAQSFSDVRKHFAQVLNQVEQTHEPVAITKHGAACAVIMPLEAMQKQNSFASKLENWLLENSAELQKDDFVFEDLRQKDEAREFSW